MWVLAHMRPDIVSFPPPQDKDSLIGHDGTLTEEEVAHLQGLGYVVSHWKSFSGAKLVQAYFEGIAKGLIEMESKTFKSMDTIRKQLSKMEAGDSDLKAPGKTDKPDAIKLLSSIGGSGKIEPYRGPGRPPKKVG